MARAPRDPNFVPTINGVSAIDGQTPTNIYVDPTTGAVYTKGASGSVIGSTPYAVKITDSGSISYVGKAVPGSSQASAVWQAMKIDTTSGTVITWANGNANFTNVATDLTALSYS